MTGVAMFPLFGRSFGLLGDDELVERERGVRRPAITVGGAGFGTAVDDHAEAGAPLEGDRQQVKKFGVATGHDNPIGGHAVFRIISAERV
jgi:hypothetical protein